MKPLFKLLRQECHAICKCHVIPNFWLWLTHLLQNPGVTAKKVPLLVYPKY